MFGLYIEYLLPLILQDVNWLMRTAEEFGKENKALLGCPGDKFKLAEKKGRKIGKLELIYKRRVEH